LEGPSRLLARLQAFLPELKRANEVLDPAQASIENQVDEDEDSSGEDESVQGPRDHDDLEQHYIEMTLGLGVFTLKKTGREQEDVSSLSGSSLSSVSSSSSSEDGESCDDRGSRGVGKDELGLAGADHGQSYDEHEHAPGRA